MEASIQARLDFVQKVMDGKYTRAQAEAELDRMEAEFGERAFLPGTAARRPKPWTMEDLRELERSAVCGAGSREFLSYLAEVGAEVHRRARVRRFLLACGCAAAVAVAAAVVLKTVDRPKVQARETALYVEYSGELEGGGAEL